MGGGRKEEGRREEERGRRRERGGKGKGRRGKHKGEAGRNWRRGRRKKNIESIQSLFVAHFILPPGIMFPMLRAQPPILFAGTRPNLSILRCLHLSRCKLQGLQFVCLIISNVCLNLDSRFIIVCNRVLGYIMCGNDKQPLHGSTIKKGK